MDVEAQPSEVDLKPRLVPSRIQYIECKIDLSGGDARIGRVFFSKTGRTLRYNGKSFRSLSGGGFKANYYCVETEVEYWISGCKRNGSSNRLYGERVPVYIDNDIRDEYWTVIRNRPDLAHLTAI